MDNLYCNALATSMTTCGGLKQVIEILMQCFTFTALPLRQADAISLPLYKCCRQGVYFLTPHDCPMTLHVCTCGETCC